MDHNEASRLQAAEKYLLRELTPSQRDEYEEHYFDCPACAEELKTTVAFMESSRQVFREKAAQVIEDKELAKARGGWFAWLRPAVAVPVFAALLLLIGYQNGVTIPRLKVSNQAAQIIGSSFQLLGSVRGGGDSSETADKVKVRQGESFLLKFDFTPSSTSADYTWQLRDRAGKVVKYGEISGDKKYQSVSLPVLGGVQSAGNYTLVFFAGENAGEVQHLTFTVEFLQ